MTTINEELKIVQSDISNALKILDEAYKPIPKIAHIGCGSPAFIRDPGCDQNYYHPGGIPLFAVASSENVNTIKLNIGGVDTNVKIFNKDGIDITHLIKIIT